MKQTFTSPPKWAGKLDEYFEVNKKVQSASAAAVILFKCDSRVLACTYGHGHTMLRNDKRENDFGLLVAANSLADTNVKLVEKANLGSVIRDFTQAAGITNLQEFNVDRALSLVRRLSGKSEKGNTSLSGASSITLSSEFDIDQLNELGKTLLELYNSPSYKKGGFAILDKIKPVLNIDEETKLNEKLLYELKTDNPSFELGVPQIDTEPIGFITIGGSRKRAKFPDLTLEVFLANVEPLQNVEDFFKYQIVTHDVDGTAPRKQWSFHKGLVGSLDIGSRRYALNEGKWYSIENALKDSANATFKKASRGLDKYFYHGRLSVPEKAIKQKRTNLKFCTIKDFTKVILSNFYYLTVNWSPSLISRALGLKFVISLMLKIRN